MIFQLCGSQICAWILILYLVIGWHLWLKKTKKKQSEVKAFDTCCFSYTQRSFMFFFSSSSFLSPFLSLLPTLSSFFGFLFCCPSLFILPSHFWLSSLLCPLSSHCLFLRFHSSLTPPPDWFLCPSIFSSNATRAASLPLASGAASVYTLMMRLQTGKSRKSRVKMTPKRACSAWWQGITTALHVIIW